MPPALSCVVAGFKRCEKGFAYDLGHRLHMGKSDGLLHRLRQSFTEALAERGNQPSGNSKT